MEESAAYSIRNDLDEVKSMGIEVGKSLMMIIPGIRDSRSQSIIVWAIPSNLERISK
jgi:uncharacterized protein (DUF1786 family)